MMKMELFGVFLLLLLSLVSAGERVKDSPHPMLFFSVGDIPELQLKARTTHKAITRRIVDAVETIKNDLEYFLPPKNHENFTSLWNEEFGNDLCALAMYCVLFPEDREALEIAHEFMERMVTQRSWEFSQMSKDDMPISHSLVGVATAFDFLYPTFSIDQRRRYFMRIRKCTMRHFERLKDTSWGRWHIQNHVWNNGVALLIGSLVMSVHDTKANRWAEMVISHLNVSLNLANLIVDGSNSEGVAYSTYSTRSMTMFISLVDRHYGIKMYDNYWLEQHFWFLYRTMIGYKENVGIGDASPTWFYGPESMLVFIDKYILRNGYGNWLAARIRENRPRPEGPLLTNILLPTLAQRWSTYHTEFLWYDAELGETNPDPSGESVLTLFSDWGVVTYGGGLPPKNTFFAFKSSYVHGRAINEIANARDKHIKLTHVEGWMSFNPGHEHPDQNSFIFYPRGQPFITEAYYGPKFSFLNNVLMFYPSPKAPCFAPYEGQIGECHKWLDFLLPEMFNTWADIIAAYTERNYVFTSGEAVGWYRKQLGLRSVYRSLVLLTSDVLVVIDHIDLKPESILERTNAFFNMRQGSLYLSNHYPEAILKHSGQEFHAIWSAAGGTKTVATVSGYEYICEYQTRESQLLNISVELQKERSTRIAYVFYHGSSPRPSLPKFTETSESGFKVAISIGRNEYEISVPTLHSNPLSRLNWLGHTGFATLFTNFGEFVTFGYQSQSREFGNTVYSHLPSLFISSMQWSGAELLAGALNKSSDFAVASLTTMHMLNENDAPEKMRADPCRWRPEDYNTILFPRWLYESYAKPYAVLDELPAALPSQFDCNPNARLVVFANNSRLDSRLSLFPRTNSVKMVHILRNPKAWVAYIIKSGQYKEVHSEIVYGFQRTLCPESKTLPSYKQLRQLVSQNQNPNPVEVLSLYWAAHLDSILQAGLSEERLLLVWLEDLVSEPERMGEMIFEEFLGMPLPSASLHYLLQYTRSKAFYLDSGEIIDYRNMNWWRDVLSQDDIETIENTVVEVMIQLQS